MPDPTELQNLLRELATHRATLAIVLQQRANLGADHAPPGVHHAIADARAAIARLKAVLRDAGVTVEDQHNDTEPDDLLPSLPPPLALPNLLPIADDLIGRAAERTQLGSWFDALAQDRHGRIGFITAPPGFGTRALLNALVDDVRADGGVALHARFWPTDRADADTIDALWNDDPLLDPAVAAIEPQLRAAWPSAARLGGRDGLARQLLARAACLAPGEPIPRELLAATVAREGDDVAVQLEDALARLVDLGLLDETADGALRIHRLIAAFARAVVQDEAAQAAVEAALIAQAYSVNKAGYPAAMQSILAHLRYATEAALRRADAQAATLSANLGFALQAQGNLAGARPYLEQALTIRQEVLGARHPDTARSLNNLGYLLQTQGDLAGARPYCEEALAIWTEVLGKRHPDTARSLNNLGMLLQAQGDLAGARPYYEQALAIWTEVLGERHPNTATSLNNLGYLLQAQGDLAGARPYYQQALAINQAELGERHPDTARSLNNLGYLLQAQGDLAGARPYLEHALAIRQAVLGERHPDTATSLNNLGALLQDLGDLAGARLYYEQALAILTAVLGPSHPSTNTVRRNIAALSPPARDTP